MLKYQAFERVHSFYLPDGGLLVIYSSFRRLLPSLHIHGGILFHAIVHNRGFSSPWACGSTAESRHSGVPS